MNRLWDKLSCRETRTCRGSLQHCLALVRACSKFILFSVLANRSARASRAEQGLSRKRWTS